MSVGVITIDGTKIKANASMDQNRSYRELVTRSCARLRRPTGARTSSTARRVVMSCPSSCAHRRAAQALADAKRRIEERKGRAAARSRARAGKWRWIWRLRCWVVRCASRWAA